MTAFRLEYFAEVQDLNELLLAMEDSQPMTVTWLTTVVLSPVLVVFFTARWGLVSMYMLLTNSSDSVARQSRHAPSRGTTVLHRDSTYFSTTRSASPYRMVDDPCLVCPSQGMQKRRKREKGDSRVVWNPIKFMRMSSRSVEDLVSGLLFREKNSITSSACLPLTAGQKA